MTLGILVSAGLGDGLSPVRYQAIIGSKVGLFLLKNSQQISLKFESKYNDYLKMNLKCRLKKKHSVILFSAVDWI